MAGNTISDINVNITATNKDLKNKLEESRLELHKQAKSYANVGRSIVQGINEPIAKANVKNKELQDTLTKTTGALGSVVNLSESLYVSYNALTPQIGKTIAAYKALSIAQKATLFGGVIAAVGAAVAIYKKLNTELDKNSDLFRTVVNVYAEAEKSIVKQKFEINNLVDVAIDLNSSLTERKNALDKLIEISPKYFGNLNAEKSSITEIWEATENYTKALLENAKAKAAQEEIIKLTKEQIDLQLKLGEARSKSNLGMTANPLLMITGGINQKKAKDYENQIEQIGVTINKLSKIYLETAGDITKKTKAEEKETKVIKEKKQEKEKLLTLLSGEALLMELGVKMINTQNKAEQDVNQRLTANLQLYKQDNDMRKLRANSMSIVQNKIRQLIDKGYTPESSAVQNLIKQYERLNRAATLRPIQTMPTQLSPSSKDDQKSHGDRAIEKMNGLKATLSYHEGIRGFFEENKHGLENLTAGLEIASNLAGNLSEIVNNFYEKRKQETQSFYDKEIALIERSKMSEEQKAKKIAQLEEQKDARLRKIQREQAIRAKRLAIFQATLNAALSVTQALATGNYAAAIAAGIYGAAQVGVIASEPVPALAKGGIATGPTLAMVGDNSDVKTNPEVIAPINDLKKMMGAPLMEVMITGKLRAKTGEIYSELEAYEAYNKRRTA